MHPQNNVWRPWRAALLAAAAGLVLAACGGSDSGGGSASIRLVNLTSSNASFDLVTVDDDDDEHELASTIAADAASERSGVAAGERSYQLRRAGNDTAVVTSSWSLTAGLTYTAIAYGAEGSLKMAMLEEDEDEPDSGKARLRVYNTSSDAGALDLYLTDAGADTDLDDAAITTTVGAASSTGFVTLSPGTRRLRLTASGDNADLRLDLPEITLAAGDITTLIVTAGPGGVLVHAATLQQAGGLVAYKNSSARVRVAAGVADNAAVLASVGGQAVGGSQRAPSVGSYRLVTAGDGLALQTTVNGVALDAQTVALKAGGDYTLVVHGSPAAAAAALLTDDNRLPTASTKAKLRLVNALVGLDNGLTLSLNYSALAIDVLSGAGSDYATTTSATDVPLEVTSPLSSTALFSITEADITGYGVYTVFMLGSGSSPYGTLRKDR
ncbi:MAG: DUF4397 domain-containing protein [Rubrivivax sp.]|nr:DUF4397 domain-containing protein [Rubrivivax sp.]